MTYYLAVDDCVLILDSLGILVWHDDRSRLPIAGFVTVKWTFCSLVSVLSLVIWVIQSVVELVFSSQERGWISVRL